MNKLRKILLSSADRLESLSGKMRGAAFKGASLKRMTLLECENQNWKNVRPCFVLSAGRSGTLLLNRLLLLSPNAWAVHHPKPELIRASKKAYESVYKTPDLFAEVFKACREEMLLEAAQHEKIFIETNNRITFFAPVIPMVFPAAVFVHLVRHPADFARSGMRRNWYSGQHDHDVGRITPKASSAVSDRSAQEINVRWDRMSQLEKIAWLWNETNQFIEDFKTHIPPENMLFIKAEALFSDPDITRQIYKFMHLRDFSRTDVANIIKSPVNKQTKGSFPDYAEWSAEQRRQLQSLAPLAQHYGYDLA